MLEHQSFKLWRLVLRDIPQCSKLGFRGWSCHAVPDMQVLIDAGDYFPSGINRGQAYVYYHLGELCLKISIFGDNVGIAKIDHQFLMVYTNHLWWLGGWFIIAIPTLSPVSLSQSSKHYTERYTLAFSFRLNSWRWRWRQRERERERPSDVILILLTNYSYTIYIIIQYYTSIYCTIL